MVIFFQDAIQSLQHIIALSQNKVQSKATSLIVWILLVILLSVRKAKAPKNIPIDPFIVHISLW